MPVVLGSPEAAAVLRTDRALNDATDANENITKVYHVKGTAFIASPDGNKAEDAYVDVDEIVHCEHISEAVDEALLQMNFRRGCDEWNGKITLLETD